MRKHGLSLLLVVMVWATAALRAEPWKPIHEEFQAEVLLETFTDAERNREVPVKFFLPVSQEPAPVVLWSHGLGGSRDNADYLGHHLADHGYVAVHLQHPGSDSVIWRGVRSRADIQQALQRNASGANFLLRVGDVSLVIDELERRQGQQDDPLAGRLDLEKIGMSGHSFGAVTTQAVIGQRFESSLSLEEERIDAALLMSPSPARESRDQDTAFSDIDVPVLHLTGTADENPLGDFQPTDRLTPFEQIEGAPQYLLVFEGGKHSVFSGQRRRGEARKPRHHDAIRHLSLAFWDAWLREDEVAREWLKNAKQELEGTLVDGDVWKVKVGGSGASEKGVTGE